MQFLRRFALKFWHLFVDEPITVAILLSWIVIACLSLPAFHLGSWSGPVLFAGIAAITFVSLRPRR